MYVSFTMDKTKMLQKLVFDLYTHQLNAYKDKQNNFSSI